MASSTFQSPTSPANASQAQQEAGSSTSVYVSPGVQQYHPSATKAWILFNGTGTVSIYTSYNVTSITDNGTGYYTITYTVAFSSTSYSANALGMETVAGLRDGYYNIRNGSFATGSIQIQSGVVNAYNALDNDRISVQVWGDQ